MKSIDNIGPFSRILNFFKRLLKSILMMTLNERIMFVALFIILGVLLYVVAQERYVKQTVSVPQTGGEYKEALVGEVKYLVPYGTKTDAEKSISKLVYSGLVKLDGKGEIVGDLAKEWSRSESGLEYRFVLREDVFFHDGSTLEATDVVETINYIKDPKNKSPLYDNWMDISLSTENEYTILFTLPHSYGPFIYHCMVGIVNSDDLYLGGKEKINGTGPFHYLEMVSNSESNVKTVKLKRNDSYYDNSPYISGITIDVYSDDDITLVDKSQYSGLAGFNFDGDKYLNLDFELGRNVIMFANLRKEFIANDENRSKIFNYQPFFEKVKINILALDNSTQKEAINKFVEKHKNSNIDFDINYLGPVDYADEIKERNYDLLFYGCNFGYDRDLYAFWHSSQNNQNNFSGYSNKESDIFLEDTRFESDISTRNSRYDQFCQKLKENNLVKIYPAISFNYKVSFDLKGISNIKGRKPEDRFNTVLEWYLKEKRVKK